MKTMLTGIGLIAGGLPLFYFFSLMAIPVIIRPEGLEYGEIFYLMSLFFFDVGFGIFHWPAFILIVVGSVIIWKKENEKQHISNYQ